MNVVESTLVAPMGLSHLVLHVREMEESHRFWADVVGMRQVGELKPTAERPQVPRMRFYVGDRGKETNHHDLALVQASGYPAPAQGLPPSALHHVAIAFPTRQAWLDRIAHVEKMGVRFDRRLEHGMTHSLYIHDPNGHYVELLYDMPREVWEGDRDAALNYLVEKSTVGAEAYDDRVEGIPVFGGGKSA